MIAKAIRFLVYSNLFISLCVVCFTVKTSLILFGNYGNLHVNLLAFFATLFLYCFHKVYRRFRFSEQEHEEERHKWVDNHKNLYYVMVVLGFIGAVSQLFYMPLRVCVLLVPVGVMAAGYSIPFISTKNGLLRLRDILWLKALWIALAYSWLTTFLPAAFVLPSENLLSSNVIFMFTRNLLFAFALVIPFDIRDIKYDEKNGMKTLPILLAISGAIRLALFMLVLFVLGTCIQWHYFSLDNRIALALCVSALVASIPIALSRPERPNLFFPLTIESGMMVQCAFVILSVCTHF